jgi:hypothetical protein
MVQCPRASEYLLDVSDDLRLRNTTYCLSPTHDHNHQVSLPCCPATMWDRHREREREGDGKNNLSDRPPRNRYSVQHTSHYCMYSMEDEKFEMRRPLPTRGSTGHPARCDGTSEIAISSHWSTKPGWRLGGFRSSWSISCLRGCNSVI